MKDFKTFLEAQGGMETPLDRQIMRLLLQLSQMEPNAQVVETWRKIVASGQNQLKKLGSGEIPAVKPQATQNDYATNPSLRDRFGKDVKAAVGPSTPGGMQSHSQVRDQGLGHTPPRPNQPY